MDELKRPREVVIVDAENPLEEIRGEFFWRDDHERVVAAARESSYRDGYADGYRAGMSHPPSGAELVRVVRRRRVLARRLIGLVACAYLIALVGSFLR